MKVLFKDLSNEIAHLSNMSVCQIGLYLNKSKEQSFTCDDNEKLTDMNKSWI
jgi:hypothetical protein